MAIYTAATEVHETLAASTVDTVTLTAINGSVTVINRSGTSEIYFTVAVSSPVVPTIGGANIYVLPAATCSPQIPFAGSKQVAVSLISSGTPTYSIEAA